MFGIGMPELIIIFVLVIIAWLVIRFFLKRAESKKEPAFSVREEPAFLEPKLNTSQPKPKVTEPRDKITKETPKIFISYRRDDSRYITERIYDRLVQRFGANHVFKDVDSIPLGVDFRQHLDLAVAQCNFFLAVIGDDWLSAGEKVGKGLLHDFSDFVRIELESALKRGIPVIPLFVQNATVPSKKDLPDSLKPLIYRNGISIRPDPDFHNDMDRLIQAIETQF